MAGRNNNFIERSILGTASFFKSAIFSEEYALKKGLLQQLDPRVKIITFVFFIISVLLIKNIFTLCCFYLFCLTLVAFSKIDLWFFLKRTLIFIPLFSVFIALPALFNGINPVLFIARVTISVSFSVLLGLATRHNELLKGLRAFGVPQIFVMTFNMCYRYIYLFAQIIENTYLGIKSRVGPSLYYKRGQKIVAWNIAYLWQRSYQFNEAVYNAMLSRGYSGEPAVLEKFKVKTLDWVWLACSAIICGWFIYYGRYHI